MIDTESRLSSGNILYQGNYIPIQEYRDIISARNLYGLNSEYTNTQLFSNNNENNVANAISGIMGSIPQYNRIRVNTNLLDNVYDSFRDNGSPLSRIGLEMLGIHMAYNSAANLAVKYLPSINLSNALKGGKLFSKNIDNSITVENDYNKSFGDKLSSFGSNVLGIDTYNMFGNANPFIGGFSFEKAIENTGNGQLGYLYKSVNKNKYKSTNSTFVKYSNEAGITLDSKRTSLLFDYNTFSFGNSAFHPYLGIKINPISVDVANTVMNTSYSRNIESAQEYAPTLDYVNENFGSTVITHSSDINNYVGKTSNLNANESERLVWGRDGVQTIASDYIKNLRGDDDIDNTEEADGYLSIITNKEGILEYTRNLLNATGGQLIDITRKAFKKDNDIVGFNGSPLWVGNDSIYSSGSGNNGKKGVRQHTVLDQYDRFAKAIRFNGNELYNNKNSGSQNSVIYKSVLPRIHPSMDGNKINNKNLMFSLENLAVGTYSPENGKYGIIDDEYGTPIPLSEVGNFGGRLMWFPPYNISINEVASANYEPTVMIGRNEPMYNYMHSERSAVVSFSLLIDIPEQLRNSDYIGNDKNKVIADFFAFGGNPIPVEYEIDTIIDKIEELKLKLNAIGGLTDVAEPPIKQIPQIEIYFPNNKPEVGEENTIINTMFNENKYEIIEGLESSNDGNGFGLNFNAYYIAGLINNSNQWEFPDYLFINQYDSIKTTDQFGTSTLNQVLDSVFSDEEYRKYYDITITGYASLLGDINDNKALGNRRVEAVKHLIYQKLINMFGVEVANTIKTNNIKTVLNVGSSNASTLGDSPENIHLKVVKEDRCATIKIARNSLPIEKKEQILNVKQTEDKININKEIKTLENKMNILKKNNSEHTYKNRDKAILKGFESISDDQFSPVFNSQTPEDFHKRLTFLQQCTRQGSAKRYDVVDDSGNLQAKNSVFGRQPICVLRIADFFHTRVIINSVTIDYADVPWDMNPEGHGMQPMMANITLQMKVIGGQSLQGPIDALQNAVSYNYYANSTFTDKGIYAKSSKAATDQMQFNAGIHDKNYETLKSAYDNLIKTREK